MLLVNVFSGSERLRVFEKGRFFVRLLELTRPVYISVLQGRLSACVARLAVLFVYTSACNSLAVFVQRCLCQQYSQSEIVLFLFQPLFFQLERAPSVPLFLVFVGIRKENNGGNLKGGHFEGHRALPRAQHDFSSFDY